MRSSPASLKRPAVLSHPPDPRETKNRRFGETRKSCRVEHVSRRHISATPQQRPTIRVAMLMETSRTQPITQRRSTHTQSAHSQTASRPNALPGGGRGPGPDAEAPVSSSAFFPFPALQGVWGRPSTAGRSCGTGEERTAPRQRDIFQCANRCQLVIKHHIHL